MKTFMNKKRLALGNSQGFTLIEVVLVLAIGGLIFLLAFIAFQQVSRNRRDTQRRTDAARIASELKNYYGDNQRSYPVMDSTGDICTADTAAPKGFRAFAKQYMCTGSSSTEFKSPSGSNYRSVNVLDALVDPDSIEVDDVILMAGYHCDAEADPDVNSIRIRLESGEVCRTL